MSKISAMMDVGKRSMLNSQTALQTVSHNIANRSTEGYSRQRVDLQSSTPVSEGRLQIGMGAKTAAVTRVNNPFLEKQIQREGSQKSFLDTQAELMSRIEQVFNEQSVKGLNQYISDFFNSFRELANTPESLTARSVVKESAELMSQDFSRVMKQLDDVQKDINFQIAGRVEEANGLIAEIASLNQQIVEIEVRGVVANDQRDRRDMLLKKLNEIMDIKIAEGDRGSVTIMSAGNAILVSGNDHATLKTQSSGEGGHLRILVKSAGVSDPVDVTERIRGGSLGAAIQIRDETLTQAKMHMNEMASTIVREVNQVHAQGFDRLGRPAGEFFDARALELPNPAEGLRLSQDVVNDLGRIAASSVPGAVGDPRIAHRIAQIQNATLFDEGKATIDDFYNSQVGRLGVLAQKAIKASEAQAEIVGQLSKLRESISGVSLDEEATKMIEFQKAFDASARLIRTADEMLETVMNLKRL
ncbi:MAG: flagellar hook-associated protein FlgK [Bdellovibrionaceae bacterium]|jgi:flagellar hook-associated protein 1 FlgK|nr:flagellar hook-associated protein FlgK [Pseudobdellovibrionaceae bacterium]